MVRRQERVKEEVGGVRCVATDGCNGGGGGEGEEGWRDGAVVRLVNRFFHDA